jgi:hypothetical protein
MEQLGSHRTDFHGESRLPLDGFSWSNSAPTGRIFMEQLGFHWTDFHGATQLPLDGYLRNLIFEYFSKFLPEDGSLIKM